MEKVHGQSHTAVAAFTRPSDTNTYAGGDVICNSTSAPVVMTFNRATLDSDAAGNTTGAGIIQHAEIVVNANQTLKPDLELWIFDTAPTLSNDNAAIAFTAADLLNLVGVIPFPVANFRVGLAGSGQSGNVACDAYNVGLPFNVIGTNNSALYGVLVVRNAYVPTSAEKYQIRLKILD